MITCSRCGRENADDARFCSNCGHTLVDAGRGTPEVRKTVTVMFMDAVGSTELGEHTDPESLRKVMTRYFDEIRTIVERHGGTVEKYIGDAVMAVFGVPAVHEDDAMRAVRAALEIRDRVLIVTAELEQQRGASIVWRTGINTGEVVAGDSGSGQRFVTGDAVNVAARLEQAAAPNEILVGEATRALVRDLVTAEAAEPIAAKGKSELLSAYRLIDVVEAGAATGRRLESPMIGRQRQRRQLREAFDEVVDDRLCHLFTVLGAAGVGKSRLVGEFLAEAGPTAGLLHGRCLSYGDGITYWPIAEAIRGIVNLGDTDDEDTVRAKVGELVDSDRDRAAVAELIGQLMGRVSGNGSKEETFWAVRTLLESLARRRPLVLVLDDIHWAEPTLLDLIEDLAELIRDAPLLLLCVARLELLEVRPEWGGGRSHATTITLDGLNESESRELMVGLLGQVELGPDLVEKIGQSAEGNPLFVEEMIGMLIDRGLLEQRDGRWSPATDLAAVTVPPSIQAVLAARLDGLPSHERSVVERGSIEGKVFHGSAVSELSPIDLRAALPEHLRALARKELVRPDQGDDLDADVYRFRHLLIRDAAYVALPKELRADLHARFAAWLSRIAAERLVEYEEIIGYHYEQAFRFRTELGTVDDQTRSLGGQAVAHLTSCAERASARGDNAAALKLFVAAHNLTLRGALGDPRLVTGLGSAMNTTGDHRGSDALLSSELQEAVAAGDELRAARAEVELLNTRSVLGIMSLEQMIARGRELLALFERVDDSRGTILASDLVGRHEFFAGHAQVATEILDDLRSRYPPEALPPLAIGMSLSARYWGPTPVIDALRFVDEIERGQGLSIQALVKRIRGGLLGLLGEFDAARPQFREARELESALGRVTLFDSLSGHFWGPMETLAGNFEAAEAMLLESFERMVERGDSGFASTVAGNIADLYVQTGRWAEAERYAQITLEISQPDDVESQSQGRSTLARSLAATGRLDEAESNSRRAIEIAEATDYVERHGTTWSDFAEVMVIAGRFDEARAAFDKSRAAHVAKGAKARLNLLDKRLKQLKLT